MIKTETYGAGVRWYCTDCDVVKNEQGRLIISWTNSKPPAECPSCDEPSVLVCWAGNRPTFVSAVLPRYKAVRMQINGAGVSSVCGSVRGEELKRDLLWVVVADLAPSSIDLTDFSG